MESNLRGIGSPGATLHWQHREKRIATTQIPESFWNQGRHELAIERLERTFV